MNKNESTTRISTNGTKSAIKNVTNDPKYSGAVRKSDRDLCIGSNTNCKRIGVVCCWKSFRSEPSTAGGRDFGNRSRTHGTSDRDNDTHDNELCSVHTLDEATSLTDLEMNSVMASTLAELSDGPPRDMPIHGSHLPALGSTQHDCGSLARVVMVRKTDQRVINRKDNPQCKVVTLETIQTYRGHKPDRTFVSQQIQENPTIVPKLSSSSVQSELHSLSLNESASTPKRSTPTKRSIKTPSPVLRKSGYSVFEVECLEAHNDYRRAHGVVPLKLNKRLCQFAEEWAKIIALRGNPVHRSNSPYGENIFCAWSSSSDLNINGREPVENWYSEITTHIFGKEPTTLKTGHFTQVVWSDSRELGVAQAKNRSGQVFVVANYDPPGNFIGSFSANVPPLLSSTSTSGSSTKSSSRLSNSFKSDRSLSSRTSPSTPNLEDFPKHVLKHHNELRRKHGAPELRLSDELNFCAQEWAETLAKEDRFAHRPNCRYGENLYCLWSSDRNANPNAKDVCRTWYDENKEYTFGTEPSRVLNSGHFTQLVWKSSLELGVGMAKTKQGKVLVVCNYHPRGNIIGQFSKNVSKTGY